VAEDSAVCVAVAVQGAGGPIRQLYHYSVPPGLAKRVARGSRVLVPFGGRRLPGIVVDFVSPTLMCDLELKALTRVYDSEPAISGSLLELGEWLSRRWLCSLGDALKCFLPGPPTRETRTVRLLLSAEEALGAADAVGERAPRQAAVLRALARRGEMTVSSLRRAAGLRDPGSVIGALARRDWVEWRARSGGVRARRRHWLRLAVGAGEVEGLVTGLSRRAPRQAEVVRYLAAAGGEALRDEVVRGVGGDAAAAARRLEAAGILCAETRACSRVPELTVSDVAAPPPELTPPQAAAVAALEGSLTQASKGDPPPPHLLFGVTASGKTEVYLRAISRCLRLGRQAIMLVPEIALTPQMLDRLTARFGDRLAVLHSALSAGERHDQWWRARRGEVDLVVGARSAVFAPLPRLGLIAIDEEHENSYKQEETPRYHARDVALERGRREGAVVLLGSATPSVESYHAAAAGDYRLLPLEERVPGRPLPEVVVVDMRRELREKNRSIFSRDLQAALGGLLERGEQAILFLNRRGHSTFVLCRECGLVLRCPNCQVSLTYHVHRHFLVCHYCDHRMGVPRTCPGCGGPYIRYFGTGTERVEAEVRARFPAARVVRLDADTTRRRGSHEALWRRFARGEADVLVGTQMVAKGFDLPRVTLVGVVAADTALGLPDFRAAERTFQLLTQVTGRTARSPLGGTALIQTYSPEHYAVQTAAAGDFRGFYEREIVSRRELAYPPFARLALVVVGGPAEEEVARAAGRVRQALADSLGLDHGGGTDPVAAKGVGLPALLGPAPAPLARLRGQYRYQLLLKFKDAHESTVRAALDEARAVAGGGVRTTVDIDPYNML